MDSESPQSVVRSSVIARGNTPTPPLAQSDPTFPVDFVSILYSPSWLSQSPWKFRRRHVLFESLFLFVHNPGTQFVPGATYISSPESHTIVQQAILCGAPQVLQKQAAEHEQRRERRSIYDQWERRPLGNVVFLFAIH